MMRKKKTQNALIPKHNVFDCRRKLPAMDRYPCNKFGRCAPPTLLPMQMQTYMVGGAVRDALLGQPVADRDWVVVGSTPEQMLAAGFTPVGKDFPVFLHPRTHEEYALARTERKSGRGYRGFQVWAHPSVTLTQDLARRDLSINAIAAPPDWDGSEAALIDPFGGVRDLRACVLRHVSDAFVEDPVRVLRLARFAARFAAFRVADETLALCRDMVRAGELDHLVPERVWQELSGALMQPAPQRAIEVLRACGALAVLLPELDRLWGVPQREDYHPEIDCGAHTMLALGMAVRLGASLPVRWAVLVHDLGKGTTPPELLPRHHGPEERSAALADTVAARLRVPSDCAELAAVVSRVHGRIHRSSELDATALLRLLEACDALRRPQRFAEVLLACECDMRGRQGHEDDEYPPRTQLLAALHAVQGVDTAAIAAATRARCKADGRMERAGEAIATAIRRARIAALRKQISPRV